MTKLTMPTMTMMTQKLLMIKLKRIVKIEMETMDKKRNVVSNDEIIDSIMLANHYCL